MPTLTAMAYLWRRDQYAVHGMFVPFFSAYLLWMDRDRLRRSAGSGNWLGVVVIASAIALLIFAPGESALVFRGISVVMAVAGLILWGFGLRCLRAAAFSVAFLVFMVPLPRAVVNAVTFQLQNFAARVAAVVLEVFGIPAYHSGVFIQMPSITLEVAEICNGLRFMMALLVLTVAFAQVTQHTLPRKLVLPALAIPTAIVANAARVAAVAVAVYYVGPQAASGVIHHAIGKVIWLLTLIPLVVVGVALRRGQSGTIRANDSNPTVVPAATASVVTPKESAFAVRQSRTRPRLILRFAPIIARSSLLRRALRRYRHWLNGPGEHVIIVSFPKCGRTWLRLMVGRAIALHLNLEDADLLEIEHLSLFVPEVPHITLTHDDLPHRRTPTELAASKDQYAGKRVILLVRDPRDVVVSAYFEKTKRVKEYYGELSSYVHEERGSAATLVRWYNIWAANSHVPADFLLVRYEDLRQDPTRELRRIVTFIGLGGVSDANIRDAVDFGRFDNMRKMEQRGVLKSHRMTPGNSKDAESFKTRKGVVGGYREYLRPAEIDYVTTLINEELSPLFGYRNRASLPGDTK